MSEVILPVNTKKYKVIKDFSVKYIATSSSGLSGEAVLTFRVGQIIVGNEYVKGFIATSPEGTAVSMLSVGDTVINVPLENLEEVKSIIDPEKVKKYGLLWALAGLGLVSGAYYLITVKKVFKKG